MLTSKALYVDLGITIHEGWSTSLWSSLTTVAILSGSILGYGTKAMEFSPQRCWSFAPAGDIFFYLFGISSVIPSFLTNVSCMYFNWALIVLIISC